MYRGLRGGLAIGEWFCRYWIQKQFLDEAKGIGSMKRQRSDFPASVPLLAALPGMGWPGRRLDGRLGCRCAISAPQREPRCPLCTSTLISPFGRSCPCQKALDTAAPWCSCPLHARRLPLPCMLAAAAATDAAVSFPAARLAPRPPGLTAPCRPHPRPRPAHAHAHPPPLHSLSPPHPRLYLTQRNAARRGRQTPGQSRFVSDREATVDAEHPR